MTRPKAAAGREQSLSPELEAFLRDAPPGVYNLFSEPEETEEDRRRADEAERESRRRRAKRRA